MLRATEEWYAQLTMPHVRNIEHAEWRRQLLNTAHVLCLKFAIFREMKAHRSYF